MLYLSAKSTFESLQGSPRSSASCWRMGPCLGCYYIRYRSFWVSSRCLRVVSPAKHAFWASCKWAVCPCYFLSTSCFWDWNFSFPWQSWLNQRTLQSLPAPCPSPGHLFRRLWWSLASCKLSSALPWHQYLVSTNQGPHTLIYYPNYCQGSKSPCPEHLYWAQSPNLRYLRSFRDWSKL